MPVRIYAHLTWTTFARLPLIDASIAAFLEKFLGAECERQGTRMLGGRDSPRPCASIDRAPRRLQRPATRARSQRGECTNRES